MFLEWKTANILFKNLCHPRIGSNLIDLDKKDTESYKKLNCIE